MKFNSVAEVERDIERYLAEHPNATDSLDGIQSWWLRRERNESTLELLREALERLIAGGTVAMRTLPDGKTVYSSAHRRNETR